VTRLWALPFVAVLAVACQGGEQRASDKAVGAASSGGGAASSDGGAAQLAGSDGKVTPPSCDIPEGMSCGADQDSCCTSLEVTGGTYYRTFNVVGGMPMGFADPATVSAFRLDKYEVTVGRFRRFVDAWNHGDGYLPPLGSGKHTHLNAGLGLANSGKEGTYEPGWTDSDNRRIAPTDDNLGLCGAYATWTPSASAQEDLPINCVNWWEASAFCIWDGGFLASEAEWKYAAAGGTEQRQFPWGSAEPGAANQYAIYGCCYPGGAGSCTSDACSGTQNIAPVGTASLGGGRWGQLDLAGSLWEWNQDYYPDDAAFIDPCTNCAYLTPTTTRVVKVGNFAEGPYYLPTWLRYDYAPANREIYLGFRCARSL
jgi:formylglycine-generating enzyme required for sulfatase activity